MENLNQLPEGTNIENLSIGSAAESQESFDCFFAANPTMIGVITNAAGQIVQFYEHPELGEEDVVYVKITCSASQEVKLFASEFWDTDDMCAGDDYEPIMRDGKMWMKWELE